MLKPNRTSALLISIQTSKELTAEYKKKLMACIHFLGEQPEIENILLYQPYGLTFKIDKDAPLTTDFDETKNVITLDHLYFVNTPIDDLALSLIPELCHATQAVENRLYSCNKSCFEDTFFFAKLGILEGNLKVAQIAHHLQKNHPLGQLYQKIIEVNGKENAAVEMAQILWNGFLTEEFSDFNSFVEEQNFADNMLAYKKAYHVHGLIENPIIPKGKCSVAEIYTDYLKKMQLESLYPWFLKASNNNVSAIPYLYMTKEPYSETIKSFTIAQPFKPDYISVLEVHPEDFSEPTGHFLYKDMKYLTPIYFNKDAIALYLFKNHYFHQINASIKKRRITPAQSDQIALGSYLMLAIDHGTVDDIKKILKKCPKVLNFMDTYQITPIQAAIISNRSHKNEIISYLLTQHPDLQRPFPNGKDILSALPEITDDALKQQIRQQYYTQRTQFISHQFHPIEKSDAQQNQHG